MSRNTSRNTPEPVTEARRHLVLVGGGHSHVQVLRRFIMEPPASLRVTVVVDTPIAVYSGMVPGFVAGQYAARELEIDVVPLARRAGAEVVLTPATGVDADAREVKLAGRPPLRYDLASFDIGSTVIGLDLPGVREHAIPTRPIARLVRQIDEMMARADELVREPRVVVVGGGAGGVELAFTLEARLRREGLEPHVTLVNAAERLLAGFPAGLATRAARRAAERGIEIRPSSRVTSVEASRAQLADGEELPFDLLVWVAGATSHGLLRESGLATDARGFVLTRSTLQVEGHDDLFAVGDCATLSAFPRTPKAGVYAVRQGPFLTDNLLAAAGGKPLREYRPQSDFLTLLNLGDGTALGAKWGLSFGGRWVMDLKDRIDRRFMERFQVLDSDGAESEGFPVMESAGEMICGGCAAKLGQDSLFKALGRLELPPDEPPVVFGAEAAEDVVAHTVADGVTVVSSLDAFRSFSADAYLVGRVAAVNAVSDLLAKGVRPRYAQALVALPDALDDDAREEYLFQTLSGARALFSELDMVLLGGHTTTAPEPLVGFQVEGVGEPAALLRKAGARPGDVLVLTKPLGTGVLLYADMRGRARGPWVQRAHDSMVVTNRAAMEAALELGANAATDVTGFGLAGHLAELLRASSCGGRVDLSRLPVLPGALELMSRGERSTFHPENRKVLRALAVDETAAGDPRLELLFDPQTSGGLLLAIRADRAAELVARVAASTGLAAAVVGEVVERAGGQAFTVVV
jgi:selenide,water dikinase